MDVQHLTSQNGGFRPGSNRDDSRPMVLPGVALPRLFLVRTRTRNAIASVVLGALPPHDVVMDQDISPRVRSAAGPVLERRRGQLEVTLSTQAHPQERLPQV